MTMVPQSPVPLASTEADGPAPTVAELQAELCGAHAALDARDQQLARLRAEVEECAELRQHLDLYQERLAECMRTRRALALELLARRGLERNPYLTPIQQRVLCVHIAHAGVPLGETIPERAAVEWLGEEGPQEAGCSPRAFKDARAVLLAHGLLAKERREPGARSKTGRPWDQWYVLGAAINGRWETLGQPPAAEEVAPDEGDADAEEVAIRPRPRTRARQRSRERDRARRLQVAADRARMKDLEAQNETLPQELRRATACRGCGTLIDAEEWHCDACREAQDPDAHGAHAAQLPAQPAGAFRRKE